MENVDKCVICDSKDLDKHNAQIAPFIAERVEVDSETDVELLVCKNCKFAFSNPRLENEELQKVYNNYRAENYQKQRQKHEIWYTEKVNKAIGNDKVELISRKANLFKLLSKHGDISSIKSILDFGGDKGQFIPDELENAEKYVYEISNVQPLTGIHKLSSIEECQSNKYDLIMCCHVLEHVPYPVEIVDSIKNMATNNTLIYFELPYEYPFGNKKFDKYISFAMNLLKIYNFVEIMQIFLQLTVKLFKSFKSKKNFFNIHEHINFFEIKTMEKMLELNNLEIKYLNIECIENLLGKQKIISCFAKNRRINSV